MIRQREELAEHKVQIKQMAASYGFDISRLASTAAQHAMQSQKGGAMSLCRTTTFLDIYIQRDLKAGLIIEQDAQELVDDFIMKIRMVRFLRTPSLTPSSPAIPSGRPR